MWFAALGNYQHDSWIIHLMYRLLIGQKEGKLDVLCCLSHYRKFSFAVDSPFPFYQDSALLESKSLPLSLHSV